MDKLKTFDNGLLECKPLKFANLTTKHFYEIFLQKLSFKVKFYHL